MSKGGKFTRVPAGLSGSLLKRKREAYAAWMGIKPVRLQRVLPLAFLGQLDRCADNAARRILIRARMEVNEKRLAA